MKKVAVIVARAGAGAQGGAERFYVGLKQGFEDIGCETTLIEVDADEATYEHILSNYEHCATLNLDEYDLVVSTKVPTYAVRHRNHVVYLVHTVRAFDDMFTTCFPNAERLAYEQRGVIHDLDVAALRSAKKVFAIGHEVSHRLYKWCGIQSEVLHPPLANNNFQSGKSGDYLFLAGRLHPWKRVDLVIRAVQLSKYPLRLLIAGEGEAEASLKKLANGDPRIEFLGRVSDEALVAHYQGAFAVPFVPKREDYGYITLEAFASGKPVITCRDSGEPTFFVRNGINGLLADPTPDSVCKAIDWLYAHPDEAVEMGARGAAVIAEMSWRTTAQSLLDSSEDSVQGKSTLTRVAVLDMQPIHPAVGGGRLRLKGLYHDLGKDFDTRYVGSYDWPGEVYREYRHTDTLLEIDVPLSVEHHLAAQELGARAGNKAVIDIAFSEQAKLSAEYLERAREEVAAASVVVFSHPWVYPLMKDLIRPDQLVIYDSQNVEGYLRAQLLNQENPAERELLTWVVRDEYMLGTRADWIWACSQEDLLRFNRVYGFDLGKMRVIPNGVMAYPTTDRPSRQMAREKLGIPLPARVALFLGSQYGPNIEAARFIDSALSVQCPSVLFVIAGGVGQALETNRENVLVTGPLDDADKDLWLAAADLAVNPMFSGSGTNIKMFEFMSWSIPVVTTPIGARGIELGGDQAILVVEPEEAAFIRAIETLSDPKFARKIGEAGRRCVEYGYAWENISQLAGHFVRARERVAGQPRPYFSVVIPSYERPDQLTSLISRLSEQIEKDFEVIVVDQSENIWSDAGNVFGFPLSYYHSPVKGAVRARNSGACLAQGEIVAFVDDDCLPERDWLLNARAYFEDRNVVGLEGAIYSDHLHDPNWRPVTNVGFEGLGFMTANLMVRSDAFQYVGGFDLEFDNPHFREDTDLGWRLQEVGAVPYAADVRVFHPAQPRSIERESQQSRARFFEKDSLLYKKHPERFKELFHIERHYQKTPGYIFWLRHGFEKNGVPLPLWMQDILNDQKS